MSDPRVEQRSLNFSRRIIYLLVALAVLVPFLVPFSLPVTPSPWAGKLYDKIESLDKGSRVLLAFDYDPSAEAELTPMARSLMKHCFRRGLVPVVMTHWISGLNMSDKICRESAEASSKELGREVKAGVDYVFLGYKPGTSNLVLNMGENLKGAFPKDFSGASTATMPAIAGVETLRDVKLGVDLAAGATVGMWIVYGSDRYGFPLAVGTTAVQAPDLYPFLHSNQLIGFLGGLRGAADYEKLLDAPSDATKGMLAQSATHLLLIILIVVANVRMFMGRAGGNRKD